MREDSFIAREPEPERMDLADEAAAYAETDFSDVNGAFVARLCDLEKRERLLVADLGAGPGDMAWRMAKERPGWHIVAVDVAWAMLAYAHNLFAGLAVPVYLAQADAKRLPFHGLAFDVVCANSILHHVTDPGAHWAEVRRILKPGGLVFMRDLRRLPAREDAQRIVATYAADASDLLREEFYRSLLAAYTAQEVRAQLAAAKLGSLRVVNSSDRHLDVFGRLP
ncbi:MAG: class I SAM-dependent methyltransferase [Candidatus Hydrogenedentota bacterium]